MDKRLFLGVLTFLSLSSNAFAWGAKGHEIVADVGTQLTSVGQAFWVSNAAGMEQLTTVPDRKWKVPATKPDEAPTHWFQVDSYFPNLDKNSIINFPTTYAAAVNQYGSANVLKNGTAPYRIHQFYQLAVQALKTGDYASAVQYAGVMSHYIGDLSQPLHVSENYDGQMTNQTGIHKYFETDNIVDKAAIMTVVMARAQSLLSNPAFIADFQGPLSDVIFRETARSIMFRDQVLAADAKYGRSGQGAAILLDLAEDRMADGAATLSIVMSRIFNDSGITLRATPVPVADPNFIEPDYIANPTVFYRQQITPLKPSSIDDDCFDDAS
jgi:hypothetical protein